MTSSSTIIPHILNLKVIAPISHAGSYFGRLGETRSDTLDAVTHAFPSSVAVGLRCARYHVRLARSKVV